MSSPSDPERERQGAPGNLGNGDCHPGVQVEDFGMEWESVHDGDYDMKCHPHAMDGQQWTSIDRMDCSVDRESHVGDVGEEIFARNVMDGHMEAALEHVTNRFNASEDKQTTNEYNMNALEEKVTTNTYIVNTSDSSDRLSFTSSEYLSCFTDDSSDEENTALQGISIKEAPEIFISATDNKQVMLQLPSATVRLNVQVNRSKLENRVHIEAVKSMYLKREAPNEGPVASEEMLRTQDDKDELSSLPSDLEDIAELKSLIPTECDPAITERNYSITCIDDESDSGFVGEKDSRPSNDSWLYIYKGNNEHIEAYDGQSKSPYEASTETSFMTEDEVVPSESSSFSSDNDFRHDIYILEMKSAEGAVKNTTKEERAKTKELVQNEENIVSSTNISAPFDIETPFDVSSEDSSFTNIGTSYDSASLEEYSSSNVDTPFDGYSTDDSSDTNVATPIDGLSKEEKSATSTDTQFDSFSSEESSATNICTPLYGISSQDSSYTNLGYYTGHSASSFTSVTSLGNSSPVPAPQMENEKELSEKKSSFLCILESFEKVATDVGMEVRTSKNAEDSVSESAELNKKRSSFACIVEDFEKKMTCKEEVKIYQVKEEKTIPHRKSLPNDCLVCKRFGLHYCPSHSDLVEVDQEKPNTTSTWHSDDCSTCQKYGLHNCPSHGNLVISEAERNTKPGNKTDGLPNDCYTCQKFGLHRCPSHSKLSVSREDGKTSPMTGIILKDCFTCQRFGLHYCPSHKNLSIRDKEANAEAKAGVTPKDCFTCQIYGLHHCPSHSDICVSREDQQKPTAATNNDSVLRDCFTCRKYGLHYCPSHKNLSLQDKQWSGASASVARGVPNDCTTCQKYGLHHCPSHQNLIKDTDKLKDLITMSRLLAAEATSSSERSVCLEYWRMFNSKRVAIPLRSEYAKQCLAHARYGQLSDMRNRIFLANWVRMSHDDVMMSLLKVYTDNQIIPSMSSLDVFPGIHRSIPQSIRRNKYEFWRDWCRSRLLRRCTMRSTVRKLMKATGMKSICIEVLTLLRDDKILQISVPKKEIDKQNYAESDERKQSRAPNQWDFEFQKSSGSGENSYARKRKKVAINLNVGRSEVRDQKQNDPENVLLIGTDKATSSDDEEGKHTPTRNYAKCKSSGRGRGKPYDFVAKDAVKRSLPMPHGPIRCKYPKDGKGDVLEKLGQLANILSKHAVIEARKDVSREYLETEYQRQRQIRLSTRRFSPVIRDRPRGDWPRRVCDARDVSSSPTRHVAFSQKLNFIGPSLRRGEEGGRCEFVCQACGNCKTKSPTGIVSKKCQREYEFKDRSIKCSLCSTKYLEDSYF